MPEPFEIRSAEGRKTKDGDYRSDADRAFLRDVLKLPNVDVGDGWLIFGLPPAEVAVHPSDENDMHEFYLISRGTRGPALREPTNLSQRNSQLDVNRTGCCQVDVR